MKIIINGIQMDAKEGATVLEAAKENGIQIPTLCYLKEINQIAACRVCVVKVAGMAGLQPACATTIAENMEIYTDTEEVLDARRRTLELICADHDMDCTACSRGIDCELRELCQQYGADDRAFGVGSREKRVDDSSRYVVRDNSKCILCRRCVGVCRQVQGMKVIFANHRAEQTDVGFGTALSETGCVGCGQCIAACPTGALSEADDTKLFWKAVFNKERPVTVILSEAAAARAGEFFGGEEGADAGGKITALLHKIGVGTVLCETETEEEYGNYWELLVKERLKDGRQPVIDGRCAAARNYIRSFSPDFKTHMLRGKCSYEYLAWKYRESTAHFKPYCVYISNCTALKGISGDEKNNSGINLFLTTKELYQVILRACVSSFTAQEVWQEIEPEPYDTFSDGAATSPAGDGTGQPQDGLRCFEADGLANLERIADLADEYGYIHVRACPDGCRNGGGAPHRKGYL